MLVTWIEPAATHGLSTPCEQRLARERSLHRQQKSRGDFFDEMAGFDQGTSKITPTAHNGQPMLDDHAKELGLHLTENAHGLLAAPHIDLPPLFPQFPDQLDRPSRTHQFTRFLGTEPIRWHIAQ